MEVVIREGESLVRFENEVIILEIVFGLVHGRPYKGFQKIPLYVPVLITHDWNLLFCNGTHKTKTATAHR
jgi:hypothetical protein